MKIDISTASMADVITAALSAFSADSLSKVQPVAMLPGRHAMDAQSFIKRNPNTPFDGSEGVLLGMTFDEAKGWDYLQLSTTPDGQLAIEADEDMTGVQRVTLPDQSSYAQISDAIKDQFIAFGTFTRQQVTNG